MLNSNKKQITKLRQTSSFFIDVVTKFPSVNRVQRGEWLKNRIQVLGPTYVKIGQFLASRSDILGDDVNLVKGLKQLQDSVDPLPWDVVRQTIDENIGINAFKVIERKPLASASIAQVHRAILKDGQQVVIKLKRPNIDEDIRLDLQIMELWLIVLSIFVGSRNNKIVDAQNMIKDIQNSILRETDLTNETTNMELVRKMVDETKSIIKVPKVYKKYCTSEMIVMEYVPSTKFNTFNDPKLAYLLMDVFVQQFLQHGVLHGDPHEGNVALDKNGKHVVMYDLGHIICLDAKMRSRMKMLVFEIMTENVDGVIRIMKQMPEIIEIREEEKLKDYIAKYIQYIKTIDIKILKSMSVDQNAEVPIKFSGKIYEIVRAFGIVEGICINIDPTFNYETVFMKYIDILLLDSDFFTYKVEQDVNTVFKMFFPTN